MIDHSLNYDVKLPSGIATWVGLPWDTGLMGYPVARLERIEAIGDYTEAYPAKAEILSTVIRDCRDAGIRYLLTRIASDDLSGIHALQDAGFQLIDGIQTFRISPRWLSSSRPVDTRIFHPSDLDAVLEIARSAFVYDRFHLDPAIPNPIADQMNESWTRNCCNGSAANAVLVAECDSRVASFVSCRMSDEGNRGTIILVATAAWARNRGAARRATVAALYWLADNGGLEVDVGTQFANIPAARLYEALGFRQIGTSLTLRKLL